MCKRFVKVPEHADALLDDDPAWLSSVACSTRELTRADAGFRPLRLESDRRRSGRNLSVRKTVAHYRVQWAELVSAQTGFSARLRLA